MQMTPTEILRSYQRSEHPAKQVHILADLNATDPDTIRRILAEQGVTFGKKKKPAHVEKAAADRRGASIVQICKDEEEYLSRRAKELPAEIEALKNEMESINKRLCAIESIKTIAEEAFGDGK